MSTMFDASALSKKRSVTDSNVYRGVISGPDRARRIASYFVLVAGSVAFLLPLWWMVSTSLKTPEEVYAYPIRWWPETPQWQHYSELFTDGPFAQYLINTLVITILGVAFSLIGSTFAAYAFARLRFPGRNVLFFLMLATIMVPAWATLIPSFIMFGLLGWLDTYLPILVPALFATPFNTFLLRQFFLTIPRELEDAAKVDGASTLRCLLTIVVPMSKPALIIVGLFAFLSYWNEFLMPLIYLSTQDKFPISLGIMNFVGEKSEDYASMMAAATIAMAPCVVLFFLAQRWFVQGVVITGVKG